MESLSDDLVMVTAERAADLADIPRQTLRYWEKTELIKPTISRQLSSRNIVRLYALPQLTELLVAAKLRKMPGITLQHMRKVLGHLRDVYDAPLRELTFAVVGKQIFFQHPDGSWTCEFDDQALIPKTLPLEMIRKPAREMARQGRSPADYGVVEKRRGVMGSKPVFKGTRVPLEAVLSFFNAGRSPKEVLAAYPSLTEDDLSKALLLISVRNRLAHGETKDDIRAKYPYLTPDEIRSAHQIRAA